MGQKAFGARCFGPNSLWRKPLCGRRQPFYGRQPRPKPLVQIVLGRTCHCAETLRLWSIAWKGACGPNCLGPNSMRRKPLCFLMLLPIDKIRIATPLNLHIPQQSTGTGYGPKSVWRKMLRPELSGAKACLWQTAAPNCFGANLSLRRDVAALEGSMERRLLPKLPRPDLVGQGAGKALRPKLPRPISARTRWGESRSVAESLFSSALARTCCALVIDICGAGFPSGLPPERRLRPKLPGPEVVGAKAPVWQKPLACFGLNPNCLGPNSLGRKTVPWYKNL